MTVLQRKQSYEVVTMSPTEKSTFLLSCRSYCHCRSRVIQFLIPIHTRLVKLSNNNKDWLYVHILLHQTTKSTFMISETVASPHKYLHPPQF